MHNKVCNITEADNGYILNYSIHTRVFTNLKDALVQVRQYFGGYSVENDYPSNEDVNLFDQAEE